MQSLSELIKAEEKTLLDVRSPQEFNANHIPGAVNIPLQEVRLRLDEIDGMAKPIVVYCLSGGRSAAAVGLLKQAGVKDVFNGGGIGQMQVMTM